MKTIRILTGGFGLILYLFAGTLPGYGQPKDTPISTPTSTATPSRTPTSTPTGTIPTLTPTPTGTEDPKNPPTSTPTATSTPTPTLSCCEEAVARGKDYDHLGGVVCCDGVKYSCFWPHNHPGLPPEGSLAYQIIEGCVIEHEDTHHDDITCPEEGFERPPFDPNKDPDCEECEAYTVELACLESRIDECDALEDPDERQACRNAVGDRIDVVRYWQQDHCGRCED